MVRITAAALLFAVPTIALAGDVEEHGHVDALVLLGPDGRLVTGGVEFDEQEFVEFTRVYEGEFALLPGMMGGQIGYTDEPGFNSLASGNTTLPAGYTALTANTALSFDAKAFAIGNATANLWHWDGNGAVNFAPANASIRFTFDPENTPSAALDGSANDITGFEIATSAGDGALHQHVDMFFEDAHLADTGFYLWSFTLKTDTGLESLPVFFVHGLGEGLDEEQHEAAIDWVALNVVPAPGAVAFGVMGLACATRRRR